jgi:glycosyltransferase involved in cell wall biosynthesis
MVSIIICTHNRSRLLSYCLQSFINQTASHDLYEVIVVDNNSKDDTKDVVSSFANTIHNLRYVVEKNIGLSHARNRGAKEARYDWISYIDDDGKAYPNYVERIILVVANFGFDCFGGRFLPWYLEPKPNWLSDDFGLFPELLNSVGELSEKQHVAGGVIVFRKVALIEIGGFPTNLGMTGNEVGYGEENWVQNEFRKKGFRIGFDPDLKIDHLVASYKFTLSWHFKRIYAKGKAIKILKGNNKSIGYAVALALFITAKRSVQNVFKLVLRKDYFYQNYLLDSFGFLVKTVALITTKG